MAKRALSVMIITLALLSWVSSISLASDRHDVPNTNTLSRTEEPPNLPPPMP